MSTVVPTPATVTVVPSRADLFLKALIVLGLGILIYLHFADRPIPPGPAPEPIPHINGVATGKAYAPALLDSLATGFEEAAAKLEKGGTMGETMTVAADSFKQHRQEAFDKLVTPTFSKVIKTGTEPRDDEHRAEIVKFQRDFAKGLRGSH